ncbi:MAG: hypothetical protein QOH90_2229 [Actinomycetota bacterium]|jgi:hypothetical protein|nr:hypothetical protein [Actinomycetota bacterium]
MGSFVRLLAIVSSGIVLLGFGFFATDELSRGSQNQQNKLDKEVTGALVDPAPIAPTPDQEAVRERTNGTFRELVDDANDVLLGPFSGLINSKERWVTHGVPALLALLLYGFGLGTLANMLPKERETGHDWRTA